MKKLIILKILLLVFAGVACAVSAWGKTVTLSWDASPSTVTGYKIYYATSSSSSLNGTGATEGDSPIDIGNVLTYVIHGLPDAADHYFAVTAYDSSNNESAYSNKVFSPPVGGGSNPVNSPPVLAEIGTKTVAEGAQLTFTITATDPNNDTLSYSASGLPEGATFNPATRSFNWTPEYHLSENTSVFPVTFKVSDGVAEDSEVVTINVVNTNRPPVLNSIGSQTLTEGDNYNLIISATDPDGNPLTYSAEPLPTGAVFVSSTRSLNWIPGNDQAGTYYVTFTASDGSLNASETVKITVNNGHEAPVLDPIGSQTIAESHLLTFVVTAQSSNGESLSYSASGLPAGAVFDPEQRRFSWTPDFTQAGHFTVKISVTDGSLSDSEIVEIAVTNTNTSPLISGVPPSSVMATTNYSFTPVASNPDGGTLVFSIVNKPSWAMFSTATGTLSGVPTEVESGSSVNIVISASNSTGSSSLPPFSIDVIAYVERDSDGDGVLDHLDAFPDDSSEWLDSDGDQIGNNSDPDDDNDGIIDQYDGFPLDDSRSSWIITATTSTGGFLTPEGESSILYGGFQRYQLTPMAGYYINDLLVDGVSVGLISEYHFENVHNHHTIAATFAPIPAGLSYDPTTPGLVGVGRVDGGDDSNNLVDGRPKQNLDYQFSIVLHDSAVIDQPRVFLNLDGYKYAMDLESGALATRANYIYTTRLGPAFLHRFYFSVEDVSGQQLWRYPQDGDLPGPTVELLNGKNLLGIAADINAYALDEKDVFNNRQVYRWVSGAGTGGSFELTDSGAPIASGEGYVLKRVAEPTLMDFSLYPEIGDSTYEIPVKPGWNLISNPYGGNVLLTDVKLRLGGAAPERWLVAAADNLLQDAVYSYLGTDWGDKNEFASATGDDSVTLIPWIGYWIYLNPTEQEASLIIPKPLSVAGE